MTAVKSTNTLFLTFQDIVELTNQIFLNPLAPITFLVDLLFSSHIISLTSQHLFGINIPVPRHHLLLKVFAIVPTLYWAKVSGAKRVIPCVNYKPDYSSNALSMMTHRTPTFSCCFIKI
ncbi:unnamed protein product [Urochloa humidicola]